MKSFFGNNLSGCNRFAILPTYEIDSHAASESSDDDYVSVLDDSIVQEFVIPETFQDIRIQGDWNYESNLFTRLSKYNKVIESFQKRSMLHLDKVTHPLYPGCKFKLQDLFLSVFFLKKKFPNHIGDELLFSTLNSISCYFPDGNLLRSVLNYYSSRRNLMRFITASVTNMCQPLSCKEISTCQNGCSMYFPLLDDTVFICSNCNEPRYKRCSFNGCTSNNPRNDCGHPLIFRSYANTLFYMSVTERITRLLSSDLRPFLSYPKLRQKPTHGTVEDILDGDAWINIHKLLPENEELIGIVLCWDGADMFKQHGDSFWPLSYFIVNFPHELRYKFHIGMLILLLVSMRFFKNYYSRHACSFSGWWNRHFYPIVR